MKNNTYIQKMTVDDLKLISNTLQEEYDNFWNSNILKSEIENPNSITLVLKNNDDLIIGFANISIILDTAELNNIVIKKSYRGQGYSSILLNELLQIVKDKNCKQINLEVSNTNITAINLYKKFKFKEVGLRKKYYSNSDAILFTYYIK